MTIESGNGHGARGCDGGCPVLGRRQFLARAGLAGGASVLLNSGLAQASAQQVMGVPALPGDGVEKPRVRVGFLQSPPGAYKETGWPGREYDSDASQVLYTRTLEAAAKEQGVLLDVQEARLGA